MEWATQPVALWELWVTAVVIASVNGALCEYWHRKNRQ